MLKALILPLVVPSLITAVGSLDMSLSGKVGWQLVDQLDDHRALSPGGRAGGGILHGDDGAGGGDRHHPRHHHPPWGRGPGEGGGQYSSDAFATSHSIKDKFLSPLLIQNGGSGIDINCIALAVVNMIYQVFTFGSETQG